MTTNLKGMKVAILATNGFEQSELAEPKKALENAGAKVDIVSPEKNKIKGWTKGNWGDEFNVNVTLDQANANNYAALVLPGGTINPDKLRLEPKAINFIKQFFQANKPIAAICHGPWTLIDAGIAKNKKLTSWPSIKIDLVNAGAKWVDAEVVIDGKLITSRKPDDLPAFNDAILKIFAEELIPTS